MVDVANVLSNVNLNSLLPSSTDVLNNIALGAATSVVLAGIKTSAGQQALDPLGLFPHPSNNPNAVQGATITASAFASLAPAAQAQLTASGVHIIAG